MPPATRKRAAKKVDATPEPTVVVTADEYTEDPDWDGTIEESVAVTDTTAEAAPVRKTRSVSPLVAATRNFEKARKAADKARAAAQKVKNVTDAVAATEADEQAAYDVLQVELSKLSG